MSVRVARPEVLLLDAGNTLVYLDHEALAACARQAGAAVEAPALARAEALAKRRYEALMTAGMSHEQGWDLHMSVLLESGGVAPAAVPAALEVIKAEHVRFNLWRKVPQGLPESLTRARRDGIRLGVVSNSEGRLMELFQRLGLADQFELVIDSALEGVRKPDPEIFRRALTRMGGVPASAALYAGDIPSVDVVGARAAGMEGVLIDTLAHFPDYRDAPRFASVSALLASFGV
ncbi:MAG TPA: HAD family hydrolase [Polyangiales bacterium]